MKEPMLPAGVGYMFKFQRSQQACNEWNQGVAQPQIQASHGYYTVSSSMSAVEVATISPSYMQRQCRSAAA